MLNPNFGLEMEAIVAVDLKNGIAKDGKIPWKSKADMKFFREQTTGCIIIMGSTTLLSLPNALPLPNRLNIVLTRTPAKYTCYPKYSQLDNILFWDEDTLFKFLNNQDLNKNLITPFRIEDAQSNGSNPVISAPERGILNEKWCKKKLVIYNYNYKLLSHVKRISLIFYAILGLEPDILAFTAAISIINGSLGSGLYLVIS